MDIQENHRIKLLNVKCKYISIVENLSKKMDFGDDIGCCLKKTWLASKLINRLDCYCFTNPSNSLVNSQFTVTMSNAEAVDFSTTVLSSNKVHINVSVLVNGITNLISKDDIHTALQLLIIELTSLGVYVSYSSSVGASNTVFTFVLACSVTSLSLSYYNASDVLKSYTGVNAVVGVCGLGSSTCYNCISDKDLPKMYSVLDKLLS